MRKGPAAHRALGARALWLLLLFAAAGCAAPGPGPALRSAAAVLLEAPELAGGRVGVCVLDAASGAMLVEHAADRGFATASNMKLLSAAVALATLGPQHTFPTELSARGEVRDGVLDGDLVVVGHGDPTLGSDADGAAVSTFVAGLQQAGIRQVRGRVLGDGSWLGSEHLGLGWQWDYLDEDYAAPFGGLCYAGNVASVTVRPGAAGPEVQVLPVAATVPALAIAQGAAGSATALTVHRRLGTDEVTVGGALARDAAPTTLRVTVRDPALFAASALSAALRIAGVVIDGEERPASGAVRVVATHRSGPLATIVEPMLRHSDNLFAEQVWRTAAKVATGSADTAAAERHAKAVLAQLGVDGQGMVLADGSGLSRRNLVQPRQLATLLLAAWRAPWGPAFRAGLPLAGRTGTLRNRFRDGPAHGRVRAKTGYISRVVCLSGYVPRPDPEAPPLVFSVMLNDFTCSDAAAKAAVDAFVQQLAVVAGW